MTNIERASLLRRAAQAVIVALSESGYPDAAWIDAESELHHADEEDQLDYAELLSWADELEGK